MSRETNNFESRVIVLKKCDLPKHKSIFSLNAINANAEAYCPNSFVSFQNYHFIDIAEAKTPGGLPEAYTEIQNQRHYAQKKAIEENYDTLYQPEFHTVQSMTLLGRKTSFWNKPTDILYITFIQQTDSSKWTYNEIENALQEFLPIKDGSDEEDRFWSLYYSLDFCDLVLFTRNIPLQRLNELLWEMSIYNNAKFMDLQDTFTICAFSRSYLRHSFSEVENGGPISWSEELAVSCKLGIQDANSLQVVKNSISNSGVKWFSYQLTGRYDLLLEAPLMPGDKLIRFLRDLDKLTTGDENSVLANFEVTLMTPMRDNMFLRVGGKRDNTEFAKLVSGRLANLYRNFKKLENTRINYIADYVYETLHSLLELVRNGFAEEFVLSVLPSLEAYLTMANSYEAACSEKGGDREAYVENQVEHFTELTYKFFSAVNTLAACTMHNERQFVQAPSFNAAYFEIPPKLLVFYNRVAQKIADILQTEKDDPYQFLIIPDYRPNINVEPFKTPVKQENQQKNIAIIYLWEKYFYDPAKAIMLLGHEVGHYMGNRFREKRAYAMFNAIGCILFQLYYAEVQDYEYTKLSQISNIAGKALGKYLFAIFIEKLQSDSSGNYYFDDVREYIFSFAKSLSSADMKNLGQEVIPFISDELQRELRTDNTLLDSYRAILMHIDQKNETTYFSGDTIFAHDYRVGCNVIASEMLDEVLSSFQLDVNLDGEKKINSTFLGVCDSAMQTFSETFADVQLLRISGKNFSVTKYVELLFESGRTVDRSIRYNVIRNMSQKINATKLDDFAPYDSQFVYDREYCGIIEQWVLEYLAFCQTDINPLRYVECFFADELNLYDQAKMINTFLSTYKNTELKKLM